MFVFSAFITASFIESIVFKDFDKNGIGGKTGNLLNLVWFVFITFITLKLKVYNLKLGGPWS